jgi:hypothetical protein
MRVTGWKIGCSGSRGGNAFPVGSPRSAATRRHKKDDLPVVVDMRQTPDEAPGREQRLHALRTYTSDPGRFWLELTFRLGREHLRELGEMHPTYRYMSPYLQVHVT